MTESIEGMLSSRYPCTFEAFNEHMNLSIFLADAMQASEPTQPGWLYKHYRYHTIGLEMVRAIAKAEGFPIDVTKLADIDKVEKYFADEGGIVA